MRYRYHCGCCNQVVEANMRECSNCGSHNIRSPYGFWIFCVLACLSVAVVVKGVHVYLKSHHEIPTSTSVLEVLQQPKIKQE